MPPVRKSLRVTILTHTEKQRMRAAKENVGAKITAPEYHGIIGERHNGYLIQFSNGSRPWPPYWVPKEQPPKDAIIAWLQARLDGDVTQIQEDPPTYRLTSYLNSPPPMSLQPQSAFDEGQRRARFVEALCEAQLEREIDEDTYRKQEDDEDPTLRALQAQVDRNRLLLIRVIQLCVAMFVAVIATVAGADYIGVDHLI